MLTTQEDDIGRRVAEAERHDKQLNRSNNSNLGAASFLFGDDDDEEEDEDIQDLKSPLDEGLDQNNDHVNNMEEDVVPDSSDEASTGPPLDMVDDEEEQNEPDESMHSPAGQSKAASSTLTGINGIVPSSSSRNSAQKTAFNKQFTVDTDTHDISRSRDSNTTGSSSSRLRSITTTEVIPSENNSLDRSHNDSTENHTVGSSILQVSIAESIKQKQTPRARPSAGVSKEVRAALLGTMASPEDARKDNQKRVDNAILSKSKGKSRAVDLRDDNVDDDDDDDDDDLLLRPHKGKPSMSNKRAVKTLDKKNFAAHATAASHVVDIDDDEDDHHADDTSLGRRKGKNSEDFGVKTSKTRKPSAARRKAIATSDDDDAHSTGSSPPSNKRKATRYEDPDDSLMLEVIRANAKESDEDDDYDGKGPARDKWSKQGKKKQPIRRKSKGVSEEPAPATVHDERSPRQKRPRGEPSAVFPTRKGKSCKGGPQGKDEDQFDVAAGDEDDLASEEPVPVGTVRKTSRTNKKTGSKETKGPQPRSKEFLDDEDMEDDEPAVSTSLSSKRENEAKVTKEVDSDTETVPLVLSSEAILASRSKPAQTYGKRGINKARGKILDTDDEEGEERQEERASSKNKASAAILSPKRASSTTIANGAAHVSTSKRDADDAAQSNRGNTGKPSSSRLQRSTSPAYAVIINTSAKKRPNARTSSSSSSTTESKAAADTVKSVERTKSNVVRDDNQKEASSDSEVACVSAVAKKKVVGSKRPHRTVESDDSSDMDEAEEEVAPGANDVAERKEGAEMTKPSNELSNKDPQVGKSALAEKTNRQSGSVVSKLDLTVGGSEDVKPSMPAVKRFHAMVVAKGGGQGIRMSGLSRHGRVPSLLTIRNAPPPKKKPLPQAPIRKKKKGEEVYSSDDEEEKNDQPEDWWDADDFYAWEQRKRKRAKLKGEIDSEDERELAKKEELLKREASLVDLDKGEPNEVGNVSD